VLKAVALFGFRHRSGRFGIGNAGRVIVAEEFHEAAERNGRQLPARAVAVVETDDLGAKADREHHHFDAAPAGDQEMTKLVKKHDNRKHKQEGDQIAHDPAAERAHTAQEIHTHTPLSHDRYGDLSLAEVY
jgi:hypothetical protein